MDRWKNRNMLNKRDALELKKSIRYNQDILNHCKHEMEQELTEINGKLDMILNRSLECREDYENIETLLKSLMVESLLREIEAGSEVKKK